MRALFATALNRIPHRTPYIQCGAVHTKNPPCRGSSPPLGAGAALLPALLAPHCTAYATACGSMRFNAARRTLSDLAHIQKKRCANLIDLCDTTQIYSPKQHQKFGW